MSAAKNELPIPSAAREDNNAVELLRVWAAKGSQHAVLSTGLWDDPGAWGILLVDLAKHAANAYSQDGTMSHAQALARIKEGLDAEWLQSTDEPTGHLEK